SCPRLGRRRGPWTIRREPNLWSETERSDDICAGRDRRVRDGTGGDRHSGVPRVTRGSHERIKASLGSRLFDPRQPTEFTPLARSILTSVIMPNHIGGIRPAVPLRASRGFALRGADIDPVSP